MRDEFVVIVTPEDHICKKFTSLMTHMETLENHLPPDEIVKGVVIVNGHLKAEDQIEKVQHKVPCVLTVGVSPTVTTAAVVTPFQILLKLLKTQQPQQQIQQQQQQQQQQKSPTRQERANKMKIYKCGFCAFQSKEVDYVRFHMHTHMNKKEPENPILNQAAGKALTPVRIRK